MKNFPNDEIMATCNLPEQATKVLRLPTKNVTTMPSLPAWKRPGMVKPEIVNNSYGILKTGLILASCVAIAASVFYGIKHLVSKLSHKDTVGDLLYANVNDVEIIELKTIAQTQTDADISIDLTKAVATKQTQTDSQYISTSI